MLMDVSPLFRYEFSTFLIGAVVALAALHRPASVLDRLEPPDDTEARILALTRKVRRRARVASWLKG